MNCMTSTVIKKSNHTWDHEQLRATNGKKTSKNRQLKSKGGRHNA